MNVTISIIVIARIKETLMRLDESLASVLHLALTIVSALFCCENIYVYLSLLFGKLLLNIIGGMFFACALASLFCYCKSVGLYFCCNGSL